jgi:hypothetical protein
VPIGIDFSETYCMDVKVSAMIDIACFLQFFLKLERLATSPEKPSQMVYEQSMGMNKFKHGLYLHYLPSRPLSRLYLQGVQGFKGAK